jgi:hypothetical protein
MDEAKISFSKISDSAIEANTAAERPERRGVWAKTLRTKPQRPNLDRIPRPNELPRRPSSQRNGLNDLVLSMSSVNEGAVIDTERRKTACFVPAKPIASTSMPSSGPSGEGWGCELVFSHGWRWGGVAI